MKRIFETVFTILIINIFSFPGYTQGYKISLKIEGLKDTSAYIGYHFGDKKYIQDTIKLNNKGAGIYEGKEDLPGGVYLVVLPGMKYFEILISDDQYFSCETDTADLIGRLKFKGSEENDIFLKYQKFMIEQQKISLELRKRREKSKEIPDSVKYIDRQIKNQDNKVKTYWNELVNKDPDTFLSVLIRSMIPLEMPEFNIPDDIENKDSLRWKMVYLFNRDHFFDFIEFSDERLLRTPVLYTKLNQYFNVVLIQTPDSIIPQIKRIVNKTRVNEKVFQYIIVFLLNNFQKSNIMGLDEVYVNIAEDYYLSGEAAWVDSTFLEKLSDRVNKIKPNLIGRVSKDLIMETSTGEWVSLHQINSKYTILYFWEPDCGYCKEATPKLYEIYQKYRDKGLEVFAVYTQEKKQVWLDFLNKRGLDWINAYDPNQVTYFRYYYDIFSTPAIYLLDKDKIIIAKRISVESLGKMLEKLL
jgi:thiol-disulfide isomerase/thioredoxin